MLERALAMGVPAMTTPGFFELVIIGLILFVLLGMMGLLVIAGVKLVGGPRRDRSREEEEARLIQEMHQGFLRMEDRIDTLETLLHEREKGGR